MHTVLDESSILGDLAGLIVDTVSGSKTISNSFNNLRGKLKFNDGQKSENHYLGGSIAKYTKDLTMTFPTLIDNSLSPETASMISKANERNIVSMLQMLFASMQLTGTDGKEIIKKVYGGDRKFSGLKYDDYVDMLTRTYDNLKDGGISSLESAMLEDAMRDAAKKMEAELKRPMKNFPTDSFSDKSLNDYSVLNINGTEKVKFAPVKEAINRNDPLNQYIDDFDPTDLKGDNTKAWRPDSYGFYHRDLYGPDGTLRNIDANPDANTSAAQNQALKYAYDRHNQINQNRFNTAKFLHQKEMDKNQKAQMIGQYRKDVSDTLSKQIMDSDIKKANEMQPTMIIIHYSEVDPNDEFKIMDQRSFIAGVKSRLISVNSSDIVDRIVSKNKTKVNFLNFIRSTTGEINFLKDFVFCLNQAKIDARNSIKRGEAAEMWKTLESLAVKNKRNKLKKSGNDASAITTLVINQETANLIKKQHDIDLNKPNVARQIMSDYNLLGIIIADESIESVKFLYDGQDMYETQAYSFMEKENNDKSYKKIINLMSQNRRF